MGGVRILTQHVALAAGDKTATSTRRELAGLKHHLETHMDQQAAATDASIKHMTFHLHAADSASATRHHSLMNESVVTRNTLEQATKQLGAVSTKHTETIDSLQKASALALDDLRKDMAEGFRQLNKAFTAASHQSRPHTPMMQRQPSVHASDTLSNTSSRRIPSLQRDASLSPQAQPSTRDQGHAQDPRTEAVVRLTKQYHNASAADQRRRHSSEIAALLAEVAAAKHTIIELQSSARVGVSDRNALVRLWRAAVRTITEKEQQIAELQRADRTNRETPGLQVGRPANARALSLVEPAEASSNNDRLLRQAHLLRAEVARQRLGLADL
ncbi:hypothetical protein BKA66DRAFT_478918 [Pyrenochaeta sp. MPI-SDFR-AT-0127]|nr:hypothetical protein BKA66DRAFT_478918 [Pyrenochaeta sp. MPI-SDFR-AT-0127]